VSWHGGEVWERRAFEGVLGRGNRGVRKCDRGVLGLESPSYGNANGGGRAGHGSARVCGMDAACSFPSLTVFA